MIDQTPAHVVIEHRLDAPIELVWQMWTDPTHFAAWYGPTGASIPVAKWDLEVGGTRHVCMEMSTPKGPMQMWFTGQFEDIVPPRRLVYTESMADEAGNVLSPGSMGMPPGHPETTTITVELVADGDATVMTMTHAGVPADSPGAAGWVMAFDKLEERLSTLR